MNMETVLPVVWYGVIGFGVLMYVLLDGFVLGIGIVAPFADDEDQRDLMMQTAAPIWDGNETWLVLGGAGLFAAFPKAYAVVLSGLYLPVLLMLVALIFRGVAFEFRFKARRSKRWWGGAFMAGSLFTAFAQGTILGALVEGMPLKQGKYVGGAFDWFSPFSMLTAVALVFGYALLGTTWLVLKTDGRVQRIARDLSRPALVAMLAFMFLVSVWLPFLESRVMARWFAWPNLLWLSPIPLLTAAVAIALWRAVTREHESRPFVLAQCLFGLGFLGLVAGLWPNIVPPDLDLWSAAAAKSSQAFVLVGVVLIVPLVLGYTWWSYRVFRGKVTADSGYEH
ncbi:MAG TPA: cytochrome d ubiquinol oxidase subunit II [Xanthomonadales bacterium]|nr:cytochrome d ubiquinol oxidase subunit II [Xanthomonadales bacterium]